MRENQFIRRILASLFVVLICSAGFGLAQAKTVESVSFLMAAPFADATQDLVQQFNQEHRGDIKLQVIKGPLETEAMSDLAISSLLLGKAPFDGLLMDVTWLAKYAEAGWLEPLESYFNEADVDTLVVGARAGNSYKGHLYRWPMNSDMGLLYYRTDLMQRPPETPDDLVQVSQALQNEKKVDWGYVWQGRQYEGLSCVYLEMIDGFGGDWLQTNVNQIGLNSKPGVEAAAWLQGLIDQGISPRSVTNYGEPEALQSFKVGDAAFMRNWPYAWAELQKSDSAVKGNVGITTMVANPGHSTATIGSWGLTVLKGSTHVDASIEAVRFLTSETAQKQLFLKYGYSPTQQRVFDDPQLLQDKPILAEFVRALKVAKSRPETPLYAQISDVLTRQLSSILTDKKTPEEGMNVAAANTNQILISAGEQS
ncbi:ABC transporter substrate-binding protein [Synechococcus sp. MVIR-18-1]|uniref:ABC transporter substrate-binding protein n=1 Tax=Synechococcus sp. MVIR-18-1 TaxID=1386941 RepID=UPI001647BDAD|nr:ABC transporter substrate-binding protein [Synechococcus sp. MVIR-18-1]QNI76479.1 ABC-type sugar transport system/ periplasmic component [Synechococcus sp. MVIR-18-1]